SDEAPRVELRFRIKRRPKSRHESDPSPDSGDGAKDIEELSELEEAAKEARLVALRLHELKSQEQTIWDTELKVFRPTDWRDMAILLRAPGGKSEVYAREFSRLNVPLSVARRGFYQSTEISDLLSLLQILDNPLQDVPLLAVFRSPVVGLTLNELGRIR